MDTIEILEAIGSNASFRHATAEHLVAILSEMDASECLVQTVITGDHHHLSGEFGQEIFAMVQSQIQAGYEDDDEDDDGQVPDRDGDDEDPISSPDP